MLPTLQEIQIQSFILPLAHGSYIGKRHQGFTRVKNKKEI
jgi:hypothetical protein